MKLWLSLTFGLNIICQAHSQGFIWTTQIGSQALGIGASSTRTKVAVDQTGNVYAIGTFQGTALFGTTNLTSAGSTDAFLAKYTNLGQLVWVKQFGGPGQDLGGDVTVDSVGNVYVTGTFQQTASFDATNIATEQASDMFVAKYSPDGSLAWVQQGAGTGSTVCFGIAVHTNGDIFCTGSVDNTSIMVEKRNASGLIMWHHELPEVLNYNFLNQGNGVRVDKDGSAFVVGQFGTTVDFGTNTLSTDYYQAVFLTKIDSNGNFLWARQAGSSVNDTGLSVALDTSGNALITGAFTQTMDIANTNLVTRANGGTDAFVAKYDSDGNFLWVRRISQFGANTGFAIAADTGDNAYVTGFVFPSQAFIEKYDATGNLLWSIFPGIYSGGSTGYGVAVGPSNHVFVATWTTGGISFDNLAFTNMLGGDLFVSAISETVPPVFIAQPASSRPGFLGGSNYTFTSAVRSVSPVSFQWQRNGTNLLSATNASLTITNAQISNNGTYQVIASNVFGSTTSSVATLAVYYRVTLSTNGSGGVSISPNNNSYYLGGSTIMLTAANNPADPFTGWSGDISQTNNPLQLMVTGHLHVIASFADAVTNIIMDALDPRVTFTGAWTNDVESLTYGSIYRFAACSTSVTASVVYRPTIAVPGYYDVSIWYPSSFFSSKAPWTVSYDGGSVTTNVNESIRGGRWLLIAAGKYFASGTNGFVSLSNNTGEPPIFSVAADAVRLVPSQPPSFVLEPQGQVAKSGATITLLSSAVGTPPLMYQWHFNGTNIASATISVLTLFQVQPANSGAYSVSVSNFLGEVTSSNAFLQVTAPSPPMLVAQPFTGSGQFQLMLTGDPGVTFSVQTSTNLIDWSVRTNLLNSTGSTLFIDTSNTNDAARFYRASWSPP